MKNSQANGYNRVGWARISRKIEDWELYFSEPFTKAQAWIDLFTFANHKRTTFFLRGNQIIIERGELAWSEKRIAERWQWSRDKVRRFLAWLKTRQQIEIRKTPFISKIFILKYDEMQSDDTTDKTADRPQTDRRRYTYKNDKNEKNEKKGPGEQSAATPPLSIIPGNLSLLPMEPIQVQTPREEAEFFFMDPAKQQTVVDWMIGRGAAHDFALRELTRFLSYWTEPTLNGKRQRWQTEKTFEIRRRLVTWLQRAGDRGGSFQRPTEPKGITI